MPLQKLQFPEYSFDIKEEGQKKLIFDVIRKKFIPLTPEEWVRQHCIMYLINHMGCRPESIAVERELRFNRLKKRFDILVFDGGIHPVCIVECKAPEVDISTNTLIQAAVYNKTFHAPWLLLTNGIKHAWLKMENGKISPSGEPVQW